LEKMKKKRVKFLSKGAPFFNDPRSSPALKSRCLYIRKELGWRSGDLRK
jgi:hypothetical protein